MTSRSPFDVPRLLNVRRGRSAHDATMDAIGQAIVSGRFPVGSILPSKEELMGRLDVSLTTLREAMQTIAAKGMLAAKARVGTRVLPRTNWNMFDADILAWHAEGGYSAEFLASLLEMRQAIEPAAAALAASRRTEQDVEALHDFAARLDIDRSARSAFVQADVAFHQRVLQASGNPFMHSIAAMIGAALSAALDLSAPKARSSDGSTVQRQHAAIADAIAARDPQAAAATMAIVIREGWIRNPGFRADAIARLDVIPFLQG